ncbi:S25 ribosomal protein-domain-containing protein [Halteromyces radiatus]|uniref:S25 ribosomal protein-domain-containing protein n=1 Tax=Halteromyces radiatus TaxID=101107 RepID=UPI00221E47D4|nr:S25 ribosomal protein-domain-containing protein [Halteromyces radiatus]KAI8082687.1 S25 ribosomal protein-domain-containing protein [Halteromyces radiatus]
MAKKDVAAKPSSSSGGKKAKKKWSAKKVKDKANNMVVLDKPTYERLFKEVPTYKLISQSVLVDRLKLNGSLARVALKELTAQGLIKPLTIHHALKLSTLVLLVMKTRRRLLMKNKLVLQLYKS